jgi:putative acetyltransferase
MTDFLIRIETGSDREGIEELLLEAFPSPPEAELVRQLREDGDVVFSLVAVEGRKVIGQALFSRLLAPDGALALGPVAVTESRRRRGIAAKLIEAGIERARNDGWTAVVVLGDPPYYQRFGFSQETVEGMSCRYAGPYLMGLVLEGKGFEGTHIEYASAFSKLS